MSSVGYVAYNSLSEVASLNLNDTDPSQAVVYPLNIYGGETFPLSQYVCQSGPRNLDYDYLIGVERKNHPQQQSRFGYANCENGYCMGIQSRGYITPANCCDNAQPKDMAPAKCYDARYISPFYSDSPAYAGARVAKKNRGLARM